MFVYLLNSCIHVFVYYLLFFLKCIGDVYGNDPYGDYQRGQQIAQAVREENQELPHPAGKDPILPNQRSGATGEGFPRLR